MSDFLVKSADIPNLEYGKYPGSRSVEELIRNGIIILDKWCGPTSHDVAATVKKLFGLKKTGNSGTLDPAVSGILPITLENACKVIPALQHLDKEYVGVMHLHKDVTDEKLNQAIKKFVGQIIQLPPVRSAVARRERKRNIYSFKMLDRKGKDAVFQVSCEAGTYIRKLISDLGRDIGGAHMAELRRIRVGRFAEPVRIQDVVDAYHLWKEGGDESIRDFVLPVEAAVEHLGKIIIKDSAVSAVANGSPLYTGGISRIQKNIQKDDLVAILTLKGELVALAKAVATSEEMLKKGLAAKIDRVIMEKGIYQAKSE
ncbi:MAG: RNA-guided pseudouridylation complex pseudouridine synthase subunit Cbf5 [Candidatus Aenigmarchaeota archaeon]|nr:RNA-guided pseudouridylation complex pseudouridine synthase subunit Cbf5 [Candidatus Aenigmarchaeota archaeon]